MPYAYCPTCECGLDAPTPEEVLRQQRSCPYCNRPTTKHCGSPEELFISMAEKIHALEQKVDLLEKSSQANVTGGTSPIPMNNSLGE